MIAQLEPIIKAAANEAEVPVEAVLAMCQVESSMNPWAIRYEPNYRWLYGRTDSMSETERTGQMMSWGLMQIMGAVAREHGFTGWFPNLCEPAIGVKYGAKHLARFYARYQNWQDAIASYNAGSPRRGGNGLYVNQLYVDAVLREWDRLERHIPLKAEEA